MKSKGFSLIEIIVVIAILGIISAVGLPMITSFTDTASEGRDQSNAQRLAHTYSIARLAGHDFASGETEIDAIVQNIVTGTTLSLSNLDQPVFVGMPTISQALQSDAITFLEYRSGHLRFKPTE